MADILIEGLDKLEAKLGRLASLQSLATPMARSWARLRFGRRRASCMTTDCSVTDLMISRCTSSGISALASLREMRLFVGIGYPFTQSGTRRSAGYRR